MRFWDSSALVPLAVAEDASASVRNLIRRDSGVLIWMLSEVEITAALWRRSRGGQLAETDRARAQRAFDELLAGAVAVTEFLPVILRARRLLATHALRWADALQLAAALFACDDQPHPLPLVTLDARLAESAAREGFTVLP
jgi:predicted nucleic acid-binding protein